MAVRNDTIYSGPATVLQQVRCGPDCWKMSLRVPWTGAIGPGQFVHVRCDEDRSLPLLRRPFSVWDIRTETGGGSVMDLVYQVVGTGTRVLEEKEPGESVGFLGPLGRGFAMPKDLRSLIFIAGGCGIVPFHLFARQVRDRAAVSPVLLLFGARNEKYLYGIDDFPPLGVDARAATEDGSRGHRGLVTDLLLKTLEETGTDVRVYACGPEPMLDAVLKIVREKKIPCEVSTEKLMACGLGACGSCVTPVRDDGDWRYSRSCTEGPCYDAEELVSDGGQP